MHNEEYEVAEINQIINTSNDMDGSNYFKQPGKSVFNKTHKIILNGEIVGGVVNLAT